MKTRVAKAILNNILWSAILAGVACLLVFLLFGGPDVDPLFYALVASIAFASGPIAFAIYREIQIKDAHPLFKAGSRALTAVEIVWSAMIWSVALALYGGIGVSLLVSWVSSEYGCLGYECSGLILIGSVPTSFMAGMITFTLYGMTRHIKFNYKQSDKSHHLVRP